MRTELGIDVAIVVDEIGVGCPPVRRVHLRRAGADVGRYGRVVTCPEPDIDEVSCSLHGIPATANGIERRTVVVRLVYHYLASLVVVPAGPAVSTADSTSGIGS